jgi:hypothetical protein
MPAVHQHETDAGTQAAFTVLFRPSRGRWSMVGTAATLREALDLCDRRGDFWFRTLATTEADAAPVLFDADEVPEAAPAAA